MVDRSDIPQFIGKRVWLIRLKMESLNHQSGLVIDWDNNKERFQVKLDTNGSIKLIKPANLYMHQNTSVAAEQFYQNFHPANFDYENFDLCIKLGFKMGQTFPETFIKIVWSRACLKKTIVLSNISKLKKLRKFLEKIIETCDFPDLLVFANVTLARLLLLTYVKRDMDLALKILEECKENHYGCLPHIFLLTAGSMFVEALKIYQQTKIIIERRTYNNIGFAKAQFYLFALIMFVEMIEKNIQPYTSEIHDEISYLSKNVNKDDPEHLYAFAKLALINKDYQSALKMSTQYQKHLSQTSAATHLSSLYKAYSIKFQCYVAMRDQKMAHECFKQVKKYAKVAKIKVHPMWKKMLKNMNQCAQNSTNVPIRTEEKCANFQCEKIESRPREFLVCSRCDVARYCSPNCQKEHWKNGHEHQCLPQKYLKKCSNCEKREKEKNVFLLCSRCMSVRYCSKECQTNHWKRVHKKNCKNLQHEEN